MRRTLSVVMAASLLAVAACGGSSGSLPTAGGQWRYDLLERHRSPGYSVVVTAPGGASFTITRRPGGSSIRTCRPAGGAGCSPKGTW